MSAEFDAFWQIYPRRVAKLAAMKAWEKALKIAPAADILAGAERYAAERNGEDHQFTAHPSSWLNAGRWMDEPAPPKRQLAPGDMFSQLAGYYDAQGSREEAGGAEPQRSIQVVPRLSRH